MRLYSASLVGCALAVGCESAYCVLMFCSWTSAWKVGAPWAVCANVVCVWKVAAGENAKTSLDMLRGACLFLAAVWWVTNAVVWKSTQLCGWESECISLFQALGPGLARSHHRGSTEALWGCWQHLSPGCRIEVLFSYWLTLWATLDSFSGFLCFLPPVCLQHSSLLTSLQQNLWFYLLRMSFKSHSAILGVTLQALCCSV